MNPIFSKELIFDRIRSGYPFWTLFVQKSFGNRSHVGSYSGDDWDEADDMQVKCSKSLARLDSLLNSLPGGVNLSIDLKNSKTANGSGIIGPLEFSTGPAASESRALGAMPSGYEPEELVKKRVAVLEQDFDRKLAKMQQEWKAEQFAAQCEDKLNEIERIKEELKEEKKKYESGVAKTADVLYLAGSKILQGILPQFFGGAPAAPAAAPAAQLAGPSQPPAQAAQPQQKDEKFEVLDSMAETMYNNYSLEQIKEFVNGIHEQLKHKNEFPRQSTQQQQPADDFDNDSDGE